MMNIEELRKIFCEDGLYAVCVENGNIASHYRIVCLQKNGAVDSIGQRNSYVKTWGCGGFLNETNIYSRGKSLCF